MTIDTNSSPNERPPSLEELDPSDSACAAMQRCYWIAGRAAMAAINVLIVGETGVGKELLASFIHQRSRQKQGPLIAINCAGLCENLATSELFGHEKGAYTGAVGARVGLLEAANGGTVFLDEIGEMPLSLQATLLRSIETRTVMPVGGHRPRSLDVRFVAATNRDLALEVKAGRFREDLYYRLDGITIELPALRDRLEDMPGLARRIIAELCLEDDRSEPKLTQEAYMALGAHKWPGNIRELKNLLRRALLFSDGGQIRPEHLELRTSPTAISRFTAATVTDDGRQRIIDALLQCGWNQGRAARLLGISRRTLIERLKRYDIPRPQRRQPESPSISTN